MNAKRRLMIVLLLLISVSVSPFWAGTITAAPVQADLLQPPPPEPPSEPPPGAGGNEPYIPPSEPSPGDEGTGEPDPYLPPSEGDAAPGEAEPPPMPYAAPTLPALPDPSSVDENTMPDVAVPGGQGGGEGEPPLHFQIIPQFIDFSVLVDRGCGAVYAAGDSIQFSVAADWEVFDPAADYWRYLEVWGSTNGAWWHQVIRGQWIGPRASVSRAGFVGRPVGNELIYARLLDRSGMILDESTCTFTSEEVVVDPGPGPDPSVDGWIGCGETQSAYVDAGAEHLWSFSGRRGRSVTITMIGDYGFDTYLQLLDPNGRLMRENDDISGSNRSSRLRAVLPRSGEYTIVAHGYEYAEGSYRLSLTCR